MARNVGDSEWRDTARDIIEALTDYVVRTNTTADELDESARAEFRRLLDEYLTPEGMEQLRRNRKGEPSTADIASPTDKPRS